jgi:TonB family protein
MSPDRARTLKNRITALYLCSLYSPEDDPGIWSEEDFYREPKLSDPEEVEGVEFSINVKLLQIWLYDRLTGEVLEKLNGTNLFPIVETEQKAIEEIPKEKDLVADQAPVDTKPILLNRPNVRYTEEATIKNIRGVVLLHALVGITGVLEEIKVISGLPSGLNDEATRAAREMQFRPAMKDGKPVPYWVALELKFNRY